MIIQNELISLHAISPHPRNYQLHPDEQLRSLSASHSRFGQYRSLVLWARPDGRYLTVAGHGILEAMRKNGATSVRADILPVETPPDTIDGILVADNETARLSVPDEEMLAQLLQEQQEAGFDLLSVGADEERLRQMLSELEERSFVDPTDDEASDELPEEVPVRSRLGDIWQLGQHTIACLDSCDSETYQALFHQKLAHMVWSDPPYGIAIVATNGFVGGGEAYDIPFGGVKTRGDVGGSASHIRKTGKPYIADKGLRGTVGAPKPFGSKDVRGSVGASNMIAVGKYYPVIGDDSTATAIASYRLCAEWFPLATQIWWGANYYANALPPSSCWIVWDKENTGNFADAELAWCSDKSAVRIFKHMWNGLMKESEKGQRRVHPTQKPVALAEWAFEKYGKECDVIFDPFLGSGMSVIAAENLGRTVIGCELSPAYIDIVIARWEKHTGHTATLLERSKEESKL